MKKIQTPIRKNNYEQLMGYAVILRTSLDKKSL